MPVPASTFYSAGAKVSAHNSFVTLLGLGASNAKILIRDASDSLLGTIDLADPAGTVDSGTGQLTFSIDGTPTASADGVAAYAEVEGGDGAVHLTMLVIQNDDPLQNRLALSNTTLVNGSEIIVVSAVVG